MYNTYTSLELYHKKTLIIAIGTVLVAIVNYSLNLFLIPALGYTGAAYATGISYFALAFFHLFACRMITKKRVFDDNFIWTIAIITSLISFLFTYLYDFILIRYSLLIFILTVIYLIQRRKIILVFNLIFPNNKYVGF
jgi:O-antigen/teichoic acid export membrane protein